MKQNKIFFIGISFVCALALCTGQLFARETSIKENVKQVEESKKQKNEKIDKVEKEDKTTNLPKKQQEEKTPFLFSDEFTNLL